jgi:hypothetical protein
VSDATSTGLSPAAREKRHLCRNCLAAVRGAYCPHCGQKQHSPIRHFSQVIGEFFTDILNFDAKLLGTLKPLLFMPGFLSREYFAGRRMRYVSPLKLYFFLSIIAFFLIQQSIDIAVEKQGAVNAQATGAAADKDMDFQIGNFNGRDWNAKSNPIILPWLPDAGNALINDRLMRLENTVKKKDWTQLVHAGLAAAPQALLVMVPLFALLLKLVYPLKRRLFMEHLIVALHNHAFLLMVISTGVVLAWMSSWRSTPPWWESLTGLLTTLMSVWVPLYFLLGLKNIYAQSWKMTVFKFLLIGFFYLQILVLGVIINFILGLLML